ncbi:MAG: hypothetical protein ACFFDT_04065 [Candidatus Hodarchaeota archaeon]
MMKSTEINRRLIYFISFTIILAICIMVISVGILFELVNPQKESNGDEFPDSHFVSVYNNHFIVNGTKYYFTGANFWQGMNLAIDGPNGNRTRLNLELDSLKRLGVTNLRIMAASEGPNSEPYRITPALLTSPGEYDAVVLDGLDYLLKQVKLRGMYVVMVLNNYWQWSGGMPQYVSWYENSSIPYPPEHDWNEFITYTSRFYQYEECQTWYKNHIQKIVNHVNPYTGLKYYEDPTIFSWELANEPRNFPTIWSSHTAEYIKTLDPNHMVATGCEGDHDWDGLDYSGVHDNSFIDYLTVHIWPQNWGWYIPESSSTYESAESNALSYLHENMAIAKSLNKPLVVEEFGLARDWRSYQDIFNPDSSTYYRDTFYSAIYNEVYNSAVSGGVLAGDNFWAWAGQARPGDKWIGDPPHETPGWYSVYDKDTSTLDIILAHAEDMNQL